MKKLLYSVLVLAIGVLVNSAAGLVIPKTAPVSAAKGKYPAISACVHKQEGDMCTLQPNPMAMVIMQGSCQVGAADIGDVKASVLKCEPRRIPLSKPAAGTATSTSDTTSAPAAGSQGDVTDTSSASEAPANAPAAAASTAVPAQGGIAGSIKSAFAAFDACRGKQAGASCALQPSPMTMVMMQGTCQVAPRSIMGGKQITGLKCQPQVFSASGSQSVASADATTTPAVTSPLADIAGAASASSATTAPALLSEGSPSQAGVPRGLPQEPGLQIPTSGTQATGA